MSLLPSKPDITAAKDAEPRVVGVESDDADDLLSALSSETARHLLGELHDDPAPPGELADRVGTSLQNAQYHLENLQEAGAVEVVDTAYSQKGREMDVYAPADQPLVIFAGDEEKSTSIRTALTARRRRPRRRRQRPRSSAFGRGHPPLARRCRRCRERRRGRGRADADTGPRRRGRRRGYQRRQWPQSGRLLLPRRCRRPGRRVPRLVRDAVGASSHTDRALQRR